MTENEDYKHYGLRRKIAETHPGAEILGTFDVVWHNGWDLDDAVAVVRQGRNPFLVTTDHGRLERIHKVEGFLKTKGKSDYSLPEVAEIKRLMGL